jgi:hypothetical protein
MSAAWAAARLHPAGGQRHGLRDAFNDPLFIREALAAPVKQLLTDAETLPTPLEFHLDHRRDGLCVESGDRAIYRRAEATGAGYPRAHYSRIPATLLAQTERGEVDIAQRPTIRRRNTAGRCIRKTMSVCCAKTIRRPASR